MISHADAAAKPDVLYVLHVLEQSDQSANASGATDQAIMQSDRQGAEILADVTPRIRFFVKPFPASATCTLGCVERAIDLFQQLR